MTKNRVFIMVYSGTEIPKGVSVQFVNAAAEAGAISKSKSVHTYEMSESELAKRVIEGITLGNSTASPLDIVEEGLDEAIQNAVVLIGGIGESDKTSLIGFISNVLNAVNQSIEVFNALFVVKDIENLNQIDKEILKKYKFTDNHLNACKEIYKNIARYR